MNINCFSNNSMLWFYLILMYMSKNKYIQIVFHCIKAKHSHKLPNVGKKQGKVS